MRLPPSIALFLPSKVTAGAVAAAFLCLSAAGVARAQQDGGDDQPDAIERTEKQVTPAPPQREHFEKTISDQTHPSGTGFTVFGGLDLGLALTYPTNIQNESNKRGYQLGGKLMGSIFTNRMAIDIGLGYLYNDIKGSNDTVTDQSTGKITHYSGTEITTRAGYAEFSPRARLGEHFELGPVGQVFYGVDASFGPAILPKNFTVLGGLQANYRWGSKLVYRAGIQAVTSVDIYERRVYLALLNFQVGIPIVRPVTIVRDSKDIVTQENVKTQRVEKPVVKDVVKEVVRMLFDSELINFEFASSKLSPDSERFLVEVGKFLAAESELWGTLIVEGHTDIRGGYEYNMKLSNDRAASVRAALLRGGVPAGRVKSVGYGYTKPLDPATTDIAYARNRRVEMNFTEVSDPSRLREEIMKIRETTRH